ncbi:GlsB/YeaQ/YmgE family stress response membrane protein [Phaeodactylibacter luteus]|uniref:GlsB/YeaQ/YmgE family stress response membrane protein n=1 Tax=Phaeodactylibacter luteus TaxID=1564516 RepID=A0A5C6RLE5_9BACT|nr:GlsB/YeaQ/YmgE family stress response membrane protein [Phaeodactylibacter luteus]
MIYTLIMGAIAGWLAGKIMKGAGYGLLINIILGIFGAFVGNWLFGFLGITLSAGLIGDIIEAAAGAVFVLFIAGLVKR